MRFLGRRCFATVGAVPSAGRLRVSLVTPERTLFADMADQVNISAERGDMGILADHVPIVEQLKPGIVEVMREGREKSRFFVAGGFAVVQPGSVLELSAIEAWPVDALNPMAIQRGLSEAAAVAGGSEKEKARAEVVREVYLAMQQAICK